MGSINDTDSDRNNILHLAARAGKMDVCKVILGQEDFQGLAARNKWGHTPAMRAVDDLREVLGEAQAGGGGGNETACDPL